MSHDPPESPRPLTRRELRERRERERREDEAARSLLSQDAPLVADAPGETVTGEAVVGEAAISAAAISQAPSEAPTSEAPPVPVPALAPPAASTNPVEVPLDVTTDPAVVRAASSEPLVPEPSPSEVETDQPSRAGRNLPVAIGVGVGLGAVFVGSLLWRSELFIVLAFALILAVVVELRTALASRSLMVPVLPIAVGSAGMLISAYVGGAQALLVAFVATAGAVFVWCVLDSNGLPAMRSGSAAVFVVAYVPFLASFLVLALTQPDGEWRVFLAVAAVVASDTGGYIAGVLWGRHPLAPTVSPKKSWEGFAGSVVLACGASVAIVTLALGMAWWFGLVIGVLASLAAVFGDLGESLIKRDLGLKDMGSVLPGHGGVLDRVDALLVAAPLLVSAFAFLAPVA